MRRVGHDEACVRISRRASTLRRKERGVDRARAADCLPPRRRERAAPRVRRGREDAPRGPSHPRHDVVTISSPRRHDACRVSRFVWIYKEGRRRSLHGMRRRHRCVCGLPRRGQRPRGREGRQRRRRRRGRRGPRSMLVTHPPRPVFDTPGQWWVTSCSHTWAAGEQTFRFVPSGNAPHEASARTARSRRRRSSASAARCSRTKRPARRAASRSRSCATTPTAPSTRETNLVLFLDRLSGVIMASPSGQPA